KQLAERFAQQQEDARRTIAQRDEKLAQQETELADLRKQIAAAQAADVTADTHDYREDETRTALIDELLHDAGWALDSPADREHPPVTGSPQRGPPTSPPTPTTTARTSHAPR